MVPLHKTPASSRDAGLTSSEVSASPGGLSAVPVAGMLSESADVGKEAVGGWGICNHSQPIIVAVCNVQVLPRGHCRAGHSAGPLHCLAGNHQVEQEGRKSRGISCHLPITQKVLDSLKGAAELWPESMKKNSCLLLSQAQGSGGEITGHSHPISGLVDSALQNSCTKVPAHRESDIIVLKGTGASVLFEATR